LGDDYVDRLFGYWKGRVRPEADLCCYWFELARRQIESGKCKRAGLLATQGIRGGANREVLQRIKQTGEIFFAESDRVWAIKGVNVQISMIGFDDGSETNRFLDSKHVTNINSNLSSLADITQARKLSANRKIAFMGDTKGGRFDITERQAIDFLDAPNPNGRPNSDVVVPWSNGLDVTRRNRNAWIIDFGIATDMESASLYENPFEYVRRENRPARESSRSGVQSWWLHERPRGDMRQALRPLARFLVTNTLSKYRLFVWNEAPTLPDHQLIIFSKSDDYYFGILQSRLHEIWALKMGSRQETRPRYTPTTCLETFPFPEPFARLEAVIGEAARDLDSTRNNWLNPPEWVREEILEFPGTTSGPWAHLVRDPGVDGTGTVRYARRVPRNAECAKKLAGQTLTKLYNKRPTWLDLAHRRLDEAVFAAYGWKPDMTDSEILSRLLALNLERANAEDKSAVAHPSKQAGVHQG
jgi:type II restriction/modification system DNA methylase subunit YeeA